MSLESSDWLEIRLAGGGLFREDLQLIYRNIEVSYGFLVY
jgi:hypothetical protein